jgi:hypothetical protein
MQTAAAKYKGIGSRGPYNMSFGNSPEQVSHAVADQMPEASTNPIMIG